MPAATDFRRRTNAVRAPNSMSSSAISRRGTSHQGIGTEKRAGAPATGGRPGGGGGGGTALGTEPMMPPSVPPAMPPGTPPATLPPAGNSLAVGASAAKDGIGAPLGMNKTAPRRYSARGSPALTDCPALSLTVPPQSGGRKSRSEERRVGKEGRSRWSPYHYKK